MPAPPPGQCRLLGGPAAWLAQALLGLLAIGALLYKRHREKPKRPIQIWSMDVSKQVLSMLVAHVCGIIIAAVVSGRSDHLVSECAWYFVAFLLDTSLGVALAIALHSTAVKVARPRAAVNSFAAIVADCGNYGTPPQFSSFWPQVLEWIVVVIIARFICGAVVYILRGGLIHVAGVLDVLFDGSPIALLYFVMICCPLIMNMLQAVIQDVALKWKGDATGLPQQAPDQNNPNLEAFEGIRLLSRGEQPS